MKNAQMADFLKIEDHFRREIVLSFFLELAEVLQKNHEGPIIATSWDGGRRVQTTIPVVDVFLSAYAINEILYWYPGTNKAEDYHFLYDGYRFIVSIEEMRSVAQAWVDQIAADFGEFKKPHKFLNGFICPRMEIYRYPEEYRFPLILADLFLNIIIDKKDNYIVQYVLKEPNAGVFLSPMDGIFYRSPKPEEPPFVLVGTLVDAGQTICTIEQSKVFSEILAEVPMEILSILVPDKAKVTKDQPIFHIRPIEPEQG